MPGKLHEKDFDIENYEEFYSDHLYGSVGTNNITTADKILGRVNWAVEVAKKSNPKIVADLGCLEGYSLLTVLNRVKGSSGTGVDLSREGIETAKRVAEEQSLDAMFINESIEDYLEGAPDNYFDMVIMFEVIEHVKDPDAVLREIRRTAKKGADILISTPAFESPHYGMDDEQNKCHIRLYTTSKKSYEAVNRHGTNRLATSMHQQLKGFSVVSLEEEGGLIQAHAKVLE